MDTDGTPLPFDYETNPDRFRLCRDTVRRCCTEEGDGVHRDVADRFAAERAGRVLDVGCGDGTLLRMLQSRSIQAIGLDRSTALLHDAPPPVVRAEAARLPFADRTFDGVAAMFMLYHLEDPVLAITEAHRVLGSSGLFAAAAPSRYDSPEITKLLPPEPVATFDAESGPELMGDVFGNVEVEAWDGPFLKLPDRAAVRDYLIGIWVRPEDASRIIDEVDVPLSVTKRGAIFYSRKT